MSVKRNLVLGGSGAIGSHLCEHLKRKGEEVINLDLKEGFDLRSQSLEEFADVDYVWFLAWDVGGAKFLTNKDNYLAIIKNNTLICDNVFSFLEKHNIPFLFTSSQLAERDNVYGITKLLGEVWAKALGGKVVKFWNVYAWEDPGIRSHVIPDIILNALKNKEIRLMTTGEEERQFIYVDDCIANLLRIRDMEVEEVHLTNGQWHSIKQIAEMVAQKLGAKVVPGDKKGYNNKVAPDATAALFEFPTSLEQGIDLIIEKTKSQL